MTPIEQVAHQSRLLSRKGRDWFIIKDLAGQWWRAFSDGSGSQIDPIRFDASETNNVRMPLLAKVEWVRLIASKNEDLDVTGSNPDEGEYLSIPPISRLTWEKAFRDASSPGESVETCDRRANRVAEALGICLAD